MKFLYIGALALVVVLSGCSSLPPVHSFDLDKSATLQQKDSMVIGVVSKAVPDPTVALPGASCLLCIAVARGTHEKLIAHVKTLTSDVSKIDNMLVEKLKSQGFNAQLITEDFKFSDVKKADVKEGQLLAARHDFREYSKQYGLTHIIVFNIYGHGMVRNYSSYAPTGLPYASVRGNVYMIDLSTNTYVWNNDIDQRLSASANWVAPPSYPELTNSYYSVVETVKDDVLEALSFDKVK